MTETHGKEIKEHKFSFESYMNSKEFIQGGYRPGSSFADAEDYFTVSSFEPAFTAMPHPCTSGAIDYIWYRSKHLCLNRVLETPCMFTDLATFQSCPNEEVPSDHFPLVAEFVFTKESTIPPPNVQPPLPLTEEIFSLANEIAEETNKIFTHKAQIKPKPPKTLPSKEDWFKKLLRQTCNK